MKETTKQLSELFQVGQKYTTFHIDGMMAMCHRAEIIVKEVDKENGRIIFSERGKRKMYVTSLERVRYVNGPIDFFVDGLFVGWDQPIHCDTDGFHGEHGIMRGNACYNFLGTPNAIRAWIDAGQLNPLFERASVLAIDPANGMQATETVVYPELVIEGKHAIIDRVLEQNAV